jgi:hypothetical protein
LPCWVALLALLARRSLACQDELSRCSRDGRTGESACRSFFLASRSRPMLPSTGPSSPQFIAPSRARGGNVLTICGAASASLGISKSRSVFWRVLLNLTRWMDSTLFMTSSRESQLILLFVVLVSCPIATVWHLRSRPGCAPREPDHEPPSACIQDVPADSDCLGNRLMIKDLPGVWVSQFGPRSRCFFWGNLEFLVWRSRLGELGVLGVLGVLGEESELPKRGQQQSRTIGSPCRFHHCAASPPHP